MATRWNVARAKASLSELLRAAADAPQEIENRGRPVAVVLGIEAYRVLSERAARTDEAPRMREFLDASAELRRQGGAELELPPRTTRPSPFDQSRKRLPVRRPAAR